MHKLFCNSKKQTGDDLSHRRIIGFTKHLKALHCTFWIHGNKFQCLFYMIQIRNNAILIDIFFCYKQNNKIYKKNALSIQCTTHIYALYYNNFKIMDCSLNLFEIDKIYNSDSYFILQNYVMHFINSANWQECIHVHCIT